MRQNDTRRRAGEQPQGRQQPQQTQSRQQPPQQHPQGQQPQFSPPQQGQQPPTQGQQPPTQGQQSPMQGQQSQMQGQQSPVQGQPGQGQSQPPQSGHGQPQSAGQQVQHSPQRQPEMQAHQQPPQSGGQQSAMVGQQGQMQQMGRQGGPGAQPPQQMGRGQTTLSSVSIDDILQSDVVTAQPDTPIPTVTAQMREEDVGSVVVVEDDEPIGVLTDRKIALALEEMPDLHEKTAEDLISDDLVTGSEDMTVYDALQQLSDDNIRRLPITDEEGTLVGIVTLDDVIVLLAKELQDSAEIIQAQSPRL